MTTTLPFILVLATDPVSRCSGFASGALAISRSERELTFDPESEDIDGRYEGGWMGRRVG